MVEFLNKNCASWWVSFFLDMADEGDLNLADLLMTECLWSSFAKVLHIRLDEVKNNWNTHCIRNLGLRQSVGGPILCIQYQSFMVRLMASLFLYRAWHWITHTFMIIGGSQLSNNQMDYHEFFQYVMNELRLAPPNDWKDAFEILRKINDAAVNGN